MEVRELFKFEEQEGRWRKGMVIGRTRDGKRIQEKKEKEIKIRKGYKKRKREMIIPVLSLMGNVSNQHEQQK
jgi:hypothetical protein